MECKHENEFLMGDKDGILCRKCGKRFASFAEITGEKADDPETPAEPKKTARRKKSDG